MAEAFGLARGADFGSILSCCHVIEDESRPAVGNRTYRQYMKCDPFFQRQDSHRPSLAISSSYRADVIVRMPVGQSQHSLTAVDTERLTSPCQTDLAWHPYRSSVMRISLGTIDHVGSRRLDARSQSLTPCSTYITGRDSG